MDHFNWNALNRAWPYLWDGVLTTAMLTAVGMTLGIFLGIGIAIGRLFGPRWLATIFRLYTDTFRSVPLILTIFWVYFLVPSALRAITGNQNLDVGPVYAALTAFVLAEAAYYGEIIRGGIYSVHVGQMHAATALGMGRFTALRLVVLPQATRNMMPSLINQTIGLLMDTSLVYVISLNDFLGAATKVAQRDGTLIEVYLFVAMGYLLICSCGVALSNALRQKHAL